MKQKTIDFAKFLNSALVKVKSVEQLSNSTNITLSHAYEIQKESVNLRVSKGEQLVGIKLGFTSKLKMEQLGVKEVIWGRLTDKMQIVNKGELHLENFIKPKVEPEIAFLLKKDVLGKTITKDNISDFVSRIAPAIEIVDSRYKNFTFSLEDIVADNCSASGYVVGEWKNFPFSSMNLDIQMKINDKVVQIGNSTNLLGNPLNAILEAFRLTKKYNFNLTKGMLILAGAATPAVFVNKNDKVNITIEKLGTVHLSVT